MGKHFFDFEDGDFAFTVDSPEIPSSAYIPAKTQPGWRWMYSVKYSCWDWRLFSWASFMVDTLA